MSETHILPLYPRPGDPEPLHGLYLRHHLLDRGATGHPFVYSNYVVSLDGRIAIEHADTGRYGPPQPITNARDWRLFQELAAQADAIVVSGRYLRELAAGTAQSAFPVSTGPGFEDLLPWRVEHGLSPQPAVVVISGSLNIPFERVFDGGDRQGIVATGADADPERIAAIEAAGGRVLRTNPGREVNGGALIDALGDAGFRRIYVIAGPVVLETVLRADRLDRLYLTHSHRLLGGTKVDTLLEGAPFPDAPLLTMRQLWYDPPGAESPGQLFACYDKPE
ncbi:MAG: dihydrofolate reductase family protein [Gammaproteobacteria bacterium]|nr:dihydrofolate reductase family protein [Gammaproteobacteria bacterium]